VEERSARRPHEVVWVKVELGRALTQPSNPHRAPTAGPCTPCLSWYRLQH
jgi:hypothetical protein